jgi:hypothetical protein
MNIIKAKTGMIQGSNKDDTGIIPRTLTKHALRTYFELSYYRFRTKLVTDEIRQKLGILDSEQDRAIREYSVDQTRILIEELQLTEEELIALGQLQQ